MLVCAIWFALGSFAQGPRVVNPASAGMSAERLDRIEPWLNGIVERGEAAGFVTLIARRGHVVHHQAVGARGLTVQDPMPLDAIFDIASMTKAFTVVSALMLLEEGLFTLDAPIEEVLPEFANPKVQDGGGVRDAAGSITVRHLFTHGSGVYNPLNRPDTYVFPTLEAFVTDMAKRPLRFDPGTAYLYGDSHDVLGLYVERLAGMPLAQFFQQRIMRPLGLQDTEYWPPQSKNDRRAILVVSGEDDLKSESRVPQSAMEAKTFTRGASGLYSTAADYWRFAQMLANGGEFNGARLLGPRTIKWLAADHMGEVADYPDRGTYFGLGFEVAADPGKLKQPYSPGSFYWGGSQGTLFWVDPKEDLVGVLMVQSTPRPRMRLREKFAQLVYAAIVD